jgi:hypothetical protein
MAVHVRGGFASLPRSQRKDATTMTTTGLDRLIPLTEALDQAGIREADFDRDRGRPPTTPVGATRYVEATQWDSFRRLLLARACFTRGGLAADEMPAWCRPGVRDAEAPEPAEDAEPTPVPEL